AEWPAPPTAPAPGPQLVATRARRLPNRSATASAARRIRSESIAPMPQSAIRNPKSQKHPRQRRRQEVRERPRDHRAEAEPGEIVLAVRDERADAADLDADRADISEAAQRERGDGERHGIELRSHRPELRVGEELVQH